MKSRLRRLGIVLVICIVVLVPALMLLSHWINGSSDGSVHVGAPASQATAPAVPLAIKTTYFTTQLPAGFNLKYQTETPANTTQLQLMAYGGATLPEQFAATVGTIPSDGLAEVGDYNLRTSQTASYTPFTPTSLPAGATAFRTVSDPAAFTVFWPHGTHYIELTLSTDGGATLDQLQTVFSQVMAQWAWL